MKEEATSRKLSGRSASDGGDARDKIGAFAGVSGRTVEKIAAVVKAAQAEPERFGRLVADMDRCGRVNGAYRRLCNMRQAEAIRAEPPPLPDGQWRVAVCDCPWPSEPDDPEPEHRAYWPFPTMTIENLCALDIGSRMHDDSILWFWVTNFHMRYAYTVLDAWGFRNTPTILTWAKTGRVAASACWANRALHHGRARQARGHAFESNDLIARSGAQTTWAQAARVL